MDGEIDNIEPEQEIKKETIAEIEYSFYILNQIIKEHKLIFKVRGKYCDMCAVL